MALRPARTVREHKRPWTRTAKRKVKKALVRGVPDPKIRAFDMGFLNPAKAELQFDIVMGEDVQIRDNALESARVMANKVFENRITRDFYFFKVRKFPHQVLREHAILTGAGADRLSSGMRKAFGKPKGRAVRTKKGEVLMTLFTLKKYESAAKEGLRRGVLKLPGNARVRKIDLTKEKLKRVIPPKKKKERK